MARRGAAPLARTLLTIGAGMLLGVPATGLALAGGPAVGAAAPGWAAAQAELVTSEPGDGAVLTAAPTGVLLTFAAAPVLADSHLVVVDDAGADVTDGPLVTASGNTLWRPIALSDSGDVAAAYHVVLADGGVVAGTLSFSVGTGAPPSQANQASLPANLHVHQIDPLSALLLVANGVVVIVVLFLLWWRRPTDPET